MAFQVFALPRDSQSARPPERTANYQGIRHSRAAYLLGSPPFCFHRRCWSVQKSAGSLRLGRSFGNTGSSLRLGTVGRVDVDAMKDWIFRTGRQRTTHHVKSVIRKDRNWLEVTTCNLTILAMTNEGDIAITVNGGQLGWFYPSEGLSDAVLEVKLERAPFIDIERERQEKIDILQDRFCVCKVQSGWNFLLP